MQSTKHFISIDGMTCVSCENRIEKRLEQIKGILKVRVSYPKAQAQVVYDSDTIDIKTIENAIESLDYKVKRKAAGDTKSEKQKIDINKILGTGIILLALFVVAKFFGGLGIFNAFPQAEQEMGYGVLFVIGLLTSLHCIAMCGGINLSQCVPGQEAVQPATPGKKVDLRPSILYNLGRVISYTIVGAVVGALGSVVSFSGAAKGIVAIIAGIFMVIMGLNMLNVFPWLKKLNPHMPKIFARKIYENKAKSNSPLVVGLLNGLMPCGPLQAMQIYALSTGSPLKGALSMFLFSLGTVPLMFGLGALSSLLNKKFTAKMMKVSAALVIVLGVFMFQNGIGLSGIVFPSIPGLKSGSANSNVAVIGNGVQTVITQLSPGSYEPITVQKGIPVRWTVQAKEGSINGCNNEIIIPTYNSSKKLDTGDNLIEFTPTESGTISYSCWMGMIRSTITVVDDISNVKAVKGADNTKTNPSGTNNGLSGIGGCCGGVAGPSSTTKEDIMLAQIVNGKQQATITVDGYGYSPGILVLQKGVETTLNFDVKQATRCSDTVTIPEYDIQINLNTQTQTPSFTPESDFYLSCWMGMLGVDVRVVDDLSAVSASDFAADSPKLPAGGCCGR